MARVIAFHLPHKEHLQQQTYIQYTVLSQRSRIWSHYNSTSQHVNSRRCVSAYILESTAS